jgi:uncharacterized protein YgbK (DUF1537 family)
MSVLAVFSLADDLSGALEVGALFAEHGLGAEVITAPADGAATERPVFVIDTETRHVSPTNAQACVSDLISRFPPSAETLLYKKTDSTMRGNIGGELSALSAALPGRSVVYSPAYPRMGRTVSEGILFVHGIPVSDTEFAHDPLNPVRRSFIPEILRSQNDERHFPLCIEEVDPGKLALRESAVLLCNGNSDEQIQQAARFVLDHRDQVIAAGPAAFAASLAGLLSERASVALPEITTCLIVNGSRHPISIEQVRHAVEHGIEVVTPGASEIRDWAIVEYRCDCFGLERAGFLGSLLAEMLVIHNPDCLLIFGGDTTHGFLKAIGEPSLYPIAEVLPGIPLTRIEGRALPNRQRDLYLLTKAGAFGNPDTIVSLRGKLIRQALRAE